VDSLNQAAKESQDEGKAGRLQQEEVAVTKEGAEVPDARSEAPLFRQQSGEDEGTNMLTKDQHSQHQDGTHPRPDATEHGSHTAQAEAEEIPRDEKGGTAPCGQDREAQVDHNLVVSDNAEALAGAAAAALHSHGAHEQQPLSQELPSMADPIANAEVASAARAEPQAEESSTAASGQAQNEAARWNTAGAETAETQTSAESRRHPVELVEEGALARTAADEDETAQVDHNLVVSDNAEALVGVALAVRHSHDAPEQQPLSRERPSIDEPALKTEAASAARAEPQAEECKAERTTTAAFAHAQKEEECLNTTGEQGRGTVRLQQRPFDTEVVMPRKGGGQDGTMSSHGHGNQQGDSIRPKPGPTSAKREEMEQDAVLFANASIKDAGDRPLRPATAPQPFAKSATNSADVRQVDFEVPAVAELCGELEEAQRQAAAAKAALFEEQKAAGAAAQTVSELYARLDEAAQEKDRLQTEFSTEQLLRFMHARKAGPGVGEVFKLQRELSKSEHALRGMQRRQLQEKDRQDLQSSSSAESRLLRTEYKAEVAAAKRYQRAAARTPPAPERSPLERAEAAAARGLQRLEMSEATTSSRLTGISRAKAKLRR
ncbi:unnamed protein product, partial [Symbiodinium sp. KB8]